MVDRFIISLLRSNKPQQQWFYAKQIPRSMFSDGLSELGWIFNYREERGEYPSERAFRSRFPKFHLAPKAERLPALVEEITDAHLLREMHKVVDKVREIHKSGGSIKNMLAQFREGAATIQQVEHDYIDLDFATSDISLSRYRERVLGRMSGTANYNPSPWPAFNELVGYSEYGEHTLVASRTSIGKAQPLTAKVLTPTGFMRMKEVEVGTLVVDEKGNSQRVVKIHPQGKIPVFRITFNDGTVVECCDDHLWSVSSHDDKKRGDYSFKVKSLKEIRKRVVSGNRLIWEVPVYEGTKNETTVNLGLNPWLLGALLGDGCFNRVGEITFTKTDAFVVQKLESLLPESDTLSPMPKGAHRIIRKRKQMWNPSETSKWVKHYRLNSARSFTKYIPQVYLQAGFKDRLALLQGLMDTDGHVVGSGQCFEHYTISPQLALQVLSLVRSLGGFAKQFVKLPKYTYKGEVRNGQPCYVTRFHITACPVTAPRHLKKLKPASRTYRKMIEKIEPIGRKECQCITVSGNSSLYVTDGYTVTHNSWLALFWAIHMQKVGERVLIVTKEMSGAQMHDRLEAVRFKLDYPLFRRAELKPRDLRRWRHLRMQFKPKQPLIISGSDSLVGSGFGPIHTKIQQHRPTVLIVDGAYLIEPSGLSRNAGPVEKLGYISNNMKRLCSANKLRGISIVQLNRQSETKNGETKASLKDIYGSDAWAQDSDFVLLISGRRGSEQRTVSVAKGRESNVGDFSINFKLSPYPDLSQCLGAANSTSDGDGDKITFT